MGRGREYMIDEMTCVCVSLSVYIFTFKHTNVLLQFHNLRQICAWSGLRPDRVRGRSQAVRVSHCTPFKLDIMYHLGIQPEQSSR